MAAIAAANASATVRHPPNLSLRIAARAGPAKRNGERADATGSGGQSEHRSMGRSVGRPQRVHHGAESGTNLRTQDSQNGHGPPWQPTHRLGKTTSSTVSNTSRRYPGRVTLRALWQVDLDAGRLASGLAPDANLDPKLHVASHRRICDECTPPSRLVELILEGHQTLSIGNEADVHRLVGRKRKSHRVCAEIDLFEMHVGPPV